MDKPGYVALNPLCEACVGCGNDLEEMLREFAHMDERSIEALRRMSRYRQGHFFDQARSKARKRLEEERSGRGESREKLVDLRESLASKLLGEVMDERDVDSLVEDYLSCRHRMGLEEKVASETLSYDAVDEQDVRAVLEDYNRKGLLEEADGSVRITPGGSRRLARYILRKILEGLDCKTSGVNPTVDEGFGVSEGFGVRKYEFGDEFCRIHVEETLLAAFGRSGFRGEGPLFGYEDLKVRETVSESRMVNGLIVDESGSMRGEKFNAAIDISLALSELTGRSRHDSLRIFLFSDSAREVRPWDMGNSRFTAGITDMGRALRAFRTKVRPESGSKQAYLITDSEPNAVDGTFVGFERSVGSVIREARRLRAEGITLNVVMVEETARLREFASTLARHNLGRVFFTTPGDMAKTVVKEYIKRRSRAKGDRN